MFAFDDKASTRLNLEKYARPENEAESEKLGYWLHTYSSNALILHKLVKNVVLLLNGDPIDTYLWPESEVAPDTLQMD